MVYIFFQNLMLVVVFKLTMRRMNTFLKNINRSVWLCLLVSSLLGIHWYIYPTYIKQQPKDQSERSAIYKLLQKD